MLVLPVTWLALSLADSFPLRDPRCGTNHLRDLEELSQPGIEQRHWVVLEPRQLPSLADLLQADLSSFEI
jgi:hypothetical protein